jgi:hypothetical protein
LKRKRFFKNPGENLGFFFRKLYRTGKIPGMSAVIVVLFFVTLILLLSSKKKVPVEFCVPATLTFSARDLHVSTIGYAAAASKRTILILSDISETHFFDTFYAKKLCDAGFNTYVITDWTRYPMERLQTSVDKPEKALSAVVNHLSSRFIGVFASGEGALDAVKAVRDVKRINVSLLVSADPRLVTQASKSVSVIQTVPWTLQFKDVIKFFKNAEDVTLKNAN